MKKLLFGFTLILICASKIYPQLSIDWISTYDYPTYGIRWLGGSTLDNQGNLYMNGSSMNYYNPMVKFSSNGSKNWVNISEDIGYGITAGNDGYVYALSKHTQMLLTKYNTNGDSIWSRSFSGNHPAYNVPYFVTTDANGNILTISVTRDTNSPSNITVIKYDNNGNPIWSNYFRTPNNNNSYIFPNSYVFDQNNNLYITGTLPNNGGGLCFFVTKITSNGITEWINFDYSSMTGSDLALDDFGNVYCTGWSTQNFGSESYYITEVYKYSPVGALTWKREYIINENDKGIYGSQIEIDSKNNVCILAVEQIHGTLKNPIHIIKYDPNGNAFSDKVTFYLRLTNETGVKQTNLKLDNFDNAYINAYGRRTISSEERGLVTAKYDSTGSLVWITSITQTSIGIDAIGDLFLKDNNIYTTGTSYKNSPATGREFLAVKYFQTTVGVLQQYPNIPDKYSLEQNYPNPFNPSTKIKFSIPFYGYTTLKVFNISGQEIKALINEEISAGNFEAEFTAGEFPSGVYFYKLESGGFISTKKMILLK
jgi:hypothetical protein